MTSADARHLHAADAVVAAIARPLRAWSLIVTIFGDAVAPRGGSIWLGNLLEILGALGVDAGVVRTALSRLVADGWVERERVGRNSFYRLTEAARLQSENAAHLIYAAPAQISFQGWTLAVLADVRASGPTRDARSDLRALAREHSAGMLSATTIIWPRTPLQKTLPARATDLGAHLFDVPPRAAAADAVILREAWPLDDLRRQFQPLQRCLGAIDTAIARAPLSELDALALRIVMIHEWRRLVLRTPDLPAALLPADWPRSQLHNHVADLYRRLWQQSEVWLDAEARDPSGPITRNGVPLSPRFARLPTE